MEQLEVIQKNVHRRKEDFQIAYKRVSLAEVQIHTARMSPSLHA